MSKVTRVLKIPSSQCPSTETQSRQTHAFAGELILNTFSEHCELPTHWHSLPLHPAEGRNLKSERSKSPILLEVSRQRLAVQGLPGIWGALHPCYVCSLCVTRDIMGSKLWQCHADGRVLQAAADHQRNSQGNGLERTEASSATTRMLAVNPWRRSIRSRRWAVDLGAHLIIAAISTR